ncbi:3-hydroxyisobutyrate dehydrogenase [Arthrobacter pigmenti]|uniref:3-hydroxyisobutyrate dehydrogenase n=1 Tax=Arthrobacter pigmenti TaxID=271432 RepID=A0A846RQF8_9MICC|nr:NAD(P)-dependent oxidoreductase [Arthrobacter pigmenti]NJC23790.1 3-hydroxyisobutyrate dehydrogenase [Arthrobacter pigmenti]
MSTVAFIGLGNMGSPMARRLIDAGYEVRGFDLSDDARAGLVDASGLAFESPAEAIAGASTVILMLPNSNIVESVITDTEVTAAIDDDTMVIDMSSSEPLRTKALEQLLASAGVRLVDAPVSGGVKGAETGTLTIMVGANDQDFDRASEVLRHLGTVRHAGQVGAGHAAKALNNLMSATHLLVSSEAIHTGCRFGIDPELLLQIVNGSSGRSGSTENKWPNFILPETYDSGFALKLMVKDMKIAVELANQVGIEAALGNSAVELWEQAAHALPDTADHTEIARWVSEMSNLGYGAQHLD